MKQTTNRRHFVKTLSYAIPSMATLSNVQAFGQSTPSKKPNIVLIVADDLGYGDVGSYGCPDISTPGIDRLAKQGVRFTNFYANAPECTPTRTALLTGRYQQRVGGLECAIGIGHVGRYDDAIRLRAMNQLGLPADGNTLPAMLKRAGYTTCISGKWHLGYESYFSPTAHDFDVSFGPLGGSADYFHHTEPEGQHTLTLNGEEAFLNGYLTDLITNHAVKFIHGHHDHPFFLYVPYTCPHTPYQGPNDRTDQRKTPENWNQGERETFAAMVENMDKGIGRILQTLDQFGLDENTVVIFMSDNGANRHGRNTPYSGYKGSLNEGGIRVPCVVRWPGHLSQGKVTDQTALTMDFTASIARIAGTNAPKDKPFDGIDIINELEQNNLTHGRTLFWRKRRGNQTWRAVRDGSMKYLSRQNGDSLTEYLFDLKADPGEKNNLMNSRKDEFKHLKQKLKQWEKEVKPVR